VIVAPAVPSLTRAPDPARTLAAVIERSAIP
jgi:hypothetical protein